MQEPPAKLGDHAEGIRVAAQHMANAVNARWPMYLRNVKQILRAAGFDERRYGFGGLLDLLKACQREGIVRVERDRRGGLRVFQGPTMPRTPVASAPAPPTASPISEPETVDVQPEPEAVDTEPIEPETITVVDTTAELLGRAKPKRPRTSRASAGSSATPSEPAPSPSRRSTKSGGARKAAATRRRTKKSDA
jgi:hypothetical protein